MQTPPPSSGAYKPLSLTFVEYKSGDLLGFVLAWFSMVPILFAVMLLAVIALRRDLTTIFYFVGFLLTEALNFVLKNVLKQPRPSGSERNTGSFSKYGMPSDHSQIMFYFSTFFALVILFRCSLHNNRPKEIALKALATLASVAVAFVVAYSRVYLEYHSVDQVLVGGVVGSLSALVWFLFLQLKVSAQFHHISSWRICEFFMIRDYTNIPNILLFQYSTERNEANIRRKIKAK